MLTVMYKINIMKINNHKVKSLVLLSLLNSVLGKEEKSTNQTEISSSIGMDFPMLENQNQSSNLVANFGEKNIAKRDSSPPKIYYPAGYPISIVDTSVPNWDKNNVKNCTTSFAVRRLPDTDGFITSSLCRRDFSTNGIDRVFSSYFYDGDNNSDKWDWFIGGLSFYSYKFEKNELGELVGYDVGLVLGSGTLTTKEWITVPYVTGLTTNDKTISERYPITSYLTLNETGQKVCAYGTDSGYRCGKLIEIDLELKIPNPWFTVPAIIFKGLNKVDLGTKKGFESEKDIGGPVYVQTDNDDGTVTAQALGYITSIFNDERTGSKFFYYTPIEKALSIIKSVSVTSNDFYVLTTVNDPTSQEFQAQVEVPTKN